MQSNRPAILLNTGHSGLEKPDYIRRIRRASYSPVFFLHDLIPITHPEYCRIGEADKHHRRLDAILSVGAGIIVNSTVTEAVLTRYAEERGYRMPICTVAPLAPPDWPTPARARPLASPYFVILGTIEPRKNHLLLLQIWQRLAEQFGDQAPRLMIIGQRGWECEQVFNRLDRCDKLRGLVIEHSRCSDADLSTALHHSQGLLFPSFEEGYGLPLVEALAAGVPVIASPLPVFREIAGDYPDYLDPLDGNGWLQRILDYAAPDSPEREAQKQRIAEFRSPSWRQHFERVDALLERIG
ncbi:glycosyltransferase family 4 protein [Magnetospirillum molischianum]